MAKKAKKVISTQKYTFEIVHYDDGTSVMNRANKGFSVIELLGAASIISNNLMGIFKDAIKKPDKVNIKSKNSPISHKPKK